ncbi:MAG: P-loop NTPase [Campylobacteraceae bacterium]|nr:P-loop NTPase [Campylobacteraceae bacterium]
MGHITIASGKGGTGKTTLSTNLAAYIAKKSEFVVLADADVEEPNAALFLHPEVYRRSEAKKAHPKWDESACTLCGDCAKHCHFNALLALPNEILIFSNLCHSCYACSELCPTGALPMVEARIGEILEGKSHGVVLVEGRLDVGQEMATPLIVQTIEKAKESTNEKTIFLCDAPPGTSCSFVEAVKDSKYVVLVTEPTLFGLNDLRLAIETAKALNKPCGVVINRVGMGNSLIEEYCKEQGVPVIGRIPHLRDIAKYYAKGELAYPHVPEFADALKQIWTHLKEIS